MKKQFAKLVLFIVMLIFVFSGCQMRREFSVTIPEETGESDFAEEEITSMQVLKYTKSVWDDSGITMLFLGLSPEEAEAYIPERYKEDSLSLVYEKDDIQLIYSSEGQMVSYADRTNGRATCYTYILDPCIYIRSTIGSNLREYYPFEDLDSCSKEDAIAFCKPYADACGYADAAVHVYAMREEELDDAAERRGGILKGGSAPDPDFKWISDTEIWNAEQEGKSEEEIREMRTRRNSVFARGVEWTKEHEAMVLLYQPYFNGKVMEDPTRMMSIIYVPALGKIVHLDAAVPYQEGEVVEEKTVITKEEAVSELLLTLGAKSLDEITVKEISMEYKIDYPSSTVRPCWRIDYDVNVESERYVTDNGTMLIDAITGDRRSGY